jgi:adhesin/invasin
MGLISKTTLLFSSFLISTFPLLAVPKLRLSSSVVGPVSAEQGTAPAAQEIEAWAPSAGAGELNAETSALRLTFTSTANWVSASAGNRRNCISREGDCLPIRFNFATQQLQPGRYSATVTVSDPAAIDAPQNVLVILQVGGGVPQSVDLFVPPGGRDEFIFQTNSRVATTASTQSGGNWLTVTQAAAGSFDFVQPFLIRAEHLSGMADGVYRGTVAVRESRLAVENRDIAVTLRVTQQPIASSTQTRLRTRLAQNATPLARTFLITNRGRGTLELSGITATTEAGGNWLRVERIAGTNYVTATFTTEGTSPGVFRGNIAIASNAVNSPLNIPVELEVVPQAPPALRLNGVLDNATFTEGDFLAAGGIVAAFGEHLSYVAPAQASALPLPNELGGIRVFVNDQPAPVYYSSFDQVNFQIPYDVRPGEGVVRIDRGSQRGNSISANFRPAVPKLLRLNLRAAGVNIPESRDFYAIAVNSDGSLSLPAEFGIPNSRPSRRGEPIVLYGLGFGQTVPPVVAGAAAPGPPNPLAQVNSGQKTVFFGALALGTGAPQEALYVGLTPGFVGLYQINVVVPNDAPSGDVPVRVQLDTTSSEYGYVAVEPR